MHKKSLEASKKMSEEESDLSGSESGHEGKGRVKEELKTESIAALRAKAQEHSAKVLQAQEYSTKVLEAHEHSAKVLHSLSEDSDIGNSPELRQCELTSNNRSRGLEIC